jgi:hypothetical protein
MRRWDVANLNFSAAVDAWTKKSRARCTAVLRQATQNLIDDAQTVGPSVENPSGGAGGKMPVDTGFLRASMSISLDGMPSGPGRGDPKQSYGYDDSAVTLKLAGVEVGRTIYAGWCANYAPYVEERYGFCRSAAQNWQSHVDAAIAEAKAKYP